MVHPMPDPGHSSPNHSRVDRHLVFSARNRAHSKTNHTLDTASPMASGKVSAIFK